MCKTVFEYLLPPFSKRLLIHTEKYRVHGFLAALMWFTVRFPNYVQSGKLLMIFMWIIIIWSILDRILFRKNSWTFDSIFDWLVLNSLIPCVSALLDMCLNIVYMLSFIYLSVSTPLQPLPRSILPYTTLLRVSLSCSLCPNYESAFFITLRPQRCSLVFPRTCSFVFFF